MQPLKKRLICSSPAQLFNLTLPAVYSFDVADFLVGVENDQLETGAVSLYQGDLLPGFSCDSLPFDDWLRQEREQLHRLALEALFKVTAHSLARADYQTAQNLARRQLPLEPWREEAHRQLIQALALQGERSAAIAQYDTCRAILAEDWASRLLRKPNNWSRVFVDAACPRCWARNRGRPGATAVDHSLCGSQG